MTGGDARARAMLRLAVLQALSRRHQKYLFEEIRKKCAGYIRSCTQTQAPERESATLELVSEVTTKLLAGAMTEPDAVADIPHAWVTDDDPHRDGRIGWLLAEIGGWQSLQHRYVDILRRGRGPGGKGVPLTDEHIEQASSGPDDAFEEQDNRRIWLGLLAAAKRQFGPQEDASLVLTELEKDSDLTDAFGSRWPISQIVGKLNRRHPNPPWTDDRVENAKRRIMTWVAREMRARGLDAIGLRDLFARCALGQKVECKTQAVPKKDSTRLDKIGDSPEPRPST